MHNNWLENVGGQFAVFDQVQEATVPKKRQCHEKSITVDSASYSFMPKTMLNEFASTCYDLKGELMENPIFSRVFSECAHCFSGHCPFNPCRWRTRLCCGRPWTWRGVSSGTCKTECQARVTNTIILVNTLDIINWYVFFRARRWRNGQAVRYSFKKNYHWYWTF